MIERKVKASTAFSYLLALLALALLQGTTDLNLIATLPDWLETILAPVAPALGAGIAGYLAKHTTRPDLGETRPADTTPGWNNPNN